ncbi:MAG: succinate dehydrogenase assembly factor 2, partial [Gammaproteobacteria bacterium]
KELDVLLENYLEQHYAAAAPEEQGAFRELLDRQDPEILDWIVGRAEPQGEALSRVVEILRTRR